MDMEESILDTEPLELVALVENVSFVAVEIEGKKVFCKNLHLVWILNLGFLMQFYGFLQNAVMIYLFPICHHYYFHSLPVL